MPEIFAQKVPETNKISELPVPSRQKNELSVQIMLAITSEMRA